VNDADGLQVERCVACHKDSPRVTAVEQAKLLSAIPGWAVVREGDVARLRRVFPFGAYRQALAFTQRVGEIADVEDHHPVVLTEARRVTVTWWTHAIGGLHRNDFIMSAKTGTVFEEVVAGERETGKSR